MIIDLNLQRAFVDHLAYFKLNIIKEKKYRNIYRNMHDKHSTFPLLIDCDKNQPGLNISI